jgi:hypothetical protein
MDPIIEIATKIVQEAHSVKEVRRRAEDVASTIVQDWTHEVMFYVFADGSVLVVSGPQYEAYGSLDEAKENV